MANAIKSRGWRSFTITFISIWKTLSIINKKDDALEIFKNIKTPKTAKNTIIDISQFKKELNKINKQGYAFDDEEWFTGMVGVSLPIKNLNNELCFCLSTHTAKSRKNIDDLKKILPQMISAASNLKKALFKD